MTTAVLSAHAERYPGGYPEGRAEGPVLAGQVKPAMTGLGVDQRDDVSSLAGLQDTSHAAADTPLPPRRWSLDCVARPPLIRSRSRHLPRLR
jgi:hypothetical protein